MPLTNAEADPLFQLLTDALRAGPGSPEWHQATGKLRERGATDTDEHRLLLEARENLASGKEYRSVRAGPGFTRRLYEQLEGEEVPTGAAHGGLPLATIIAIVSGLVVAALLVWGVWQLIPRGPAPTPATSSDAVNELSAAFFPTEVSAARFTGGTMPADWQALGQLPLEASKAGLKPTLAPAAPAQAVGGGVVAPIALPADEPFAAEVKLRLNKPSEVVIVEVFVTAATDYSADRATSTNELVWLLKGTKQQVVLGEARQQAEAPRPEPGKAPQGGKPDAPGTDAADLTVRLRVARDVAIVESNGQRLWAGPHGLPATPRHVGVRFLRAPDSPKAHDPAVILSAQVIKK